MQDDYFTLKETTIDIENEPDHKIQRIAEDEYETENSMFYDQKFADELRVLCKGG